jgi:hypothetical protein
MTMKIGGFEKFSIQLFSIESGSVKDLKLVTQIFDGPTRPKVPDQTSLDCL